MDIFRRWTASSSPETPITPPFNVRFPHSMAPWKVQTVLHMLCSLLAFVIVLGRLYFENQIYYLNDLFSFLSSKLAVSQKGVEILQRGLPIISKNLLHFGDVLREPVQVTLHDKHPVVVLRKVEQWSKSRTSLTLRYFD